MFIKIHPRSGRAICHQTMQPQKQNLSNSATWASSKALNQNQHKSFTALEKASSPVEVFTENGRPIMVVNQNTS